jgi:AcrR family transcriptional regulator
MREADVLTVQDAEPAAVPAGSAGTAGPAPRRPGRPRSERADRAILDATLDLFAESGVGGVCIEAVAARAGVGKATIYRRWPGKEELLLDALTTLKSPLPEPRGESVREDLVAMLRVMSADAADPRWLSRYSLVLGEGAKYPKLMETYKSSVIEPRREKIRSVLRRGIASGELRPDVDVEVALAMLNGAIIVSGKHDAASLTPDYADRVVDEILSGLTPR